MADEPVAHEAPRVRGNLRNQATDLAYIWRITMDAGMDRQYIGLRTGERGTV